MLLRAPCALCFSPSTSIPYAPLKQDLSLHPRPAASFAGLTPDEIPKAQLTTASETFPASQLAKGSEHSSHLPEALRKKNPAQP